MKKLLFLMFSISFLSINCPLVKIEIPRKYLDQAIQYMNNSKSYRNDIQPGMLEPVDVSQDVLMFDANLIKKDSNNIKIGNIGTYNDYDILLNIKEGGTIEAEGENKYIESIQNYVFNNAISKNSPLRFLITRQGTEPDKFWLINSYIEYDETKMSTKLNSYSTSGQWINVFISNLSDKAKTIYPSSNPS